MTPFEQGFFTFMKVAGLMDDLRDTQRAMRGEETDSQMLLNAAALGLGAAHAPATVDQLFNLTQDPTVQGLSRTDRLKDFYTGKRYPLSTVEDYVAALNSPQGVSGQFDDVLLDDPGRGGRVVRRALSEMPSYMRRHPVRFGLGLLGAGATGHAAYRLGKGLNERYGEGSPMITPTEAGIAAAGLGALGTGAGLYYAHQQGMLPKIRLEMPESDTQGFEP